MTLAQLGQATALFLCLVAFYLLSCATGTSCLTGKVVVQLMTTYPKIVTLKKW